MELKRIKLKEFITLPDATDYIFAIQFSEQFNGEVDCMEIGDIYDLPFGLIKDFQEDLSKGNISLLSQIEYIKKIKPNINIGEYYLDEVTRTSSWLTQQIINLIETEVEMLSSDISVEDEQAGINELFAGLGTILQIRTLANNDITKQEIVKQIPYSVCFLELYIRKQENEFNQRRQNKNKEIIN